MEVKIKQGNEMLDATIEMVGGVMVVSPKEVKFVPKDGDVVYARGFVFIYKDDLMAEAYYYVCLYLKTNKIKLPDGGHIGYVSQLRLATEEEKKKLFDRIAEEGFAWDAERKELVKIKWKPKVGDIYFRPNFNRCMFMCYEGKCRYDTMRYIKDCVEKGWVFRTKEECQESCNRLNDAINSIKP